MAIFKSIDDMIYKTKGLVHQALSSDEIIDLIKETMSEAVEEVVYATYESTAFTPYERRENEGGLSDVRNYKHEITITPDMFKIRVYNNTPSMGKEKDLSTLIINGIGYDWENSDIYKMQPYPRDFIKVALRELIESGKLKRLIKQKLESKGLRLVD